MWNLGGRSKIYDFKVYLLGAGISSAILLLYEKSRLLFPIEWEGEPGLFDKALKFGLYLPGSGTYIVYADCEVPNLFPMVNIGGVYYWSNLELGV